MGWCGKLKRLYAVYGCSDLVRVKSALGSDTHWHFAVVIFITSNVFGSVAQIASLPVVILAPLGAVSLLWNALFARLILRPPLILGTALIGGGAALIAVYGVVPGPETSRSVNELIALFARPAFLAWFCVEGAIVVVCLIVVWFYPLSS